MRRRHICIPVVLALALVCGCSRTDDFNPITMAPKVDAGTKAAHSGGALDGSYVMRVSAHMRETGVTGPGRDYFTGVPFRLVDGCWSSDPARYWPLGGKMSFLCVAFPRELDPVLGGSLVWNGDDCTAAVSLDVPDFECLDDEVLVGAVTTGQKTGAAGLELQHTQTWLEFRIGMDAALEELVRVDRVTLKDICAGGELRVRNREFFETDWEFRGHSYVDVDVPGFPQVFTGTEPIRAGVLLPPQDQGAIELTYRVRRDVSQSWDDAVVKTGTYPAGKRMWAPAKKNVYQVTLSLKVISFDLVVESWQGSQTSVEV